MHILKLNPENICHANVNLFENAVASVLTFTFNGKHIKE